MKRTLLLSLSALLLSACSSQSGNWGFPYIPSIQQGNWITENQLNQLRKGMTKEQVEYLMGSPLVVDVFNANNWSYSYYYKRPFHQPIIRNLTIKFQNNRVIQWESDKLPDFQPYPNGAGIEVK
ncbi:outer membrane protein assembly factor BamE [Basilea psittacipulmonis]|nr:outer membrane protein assembly factor BamE [Basilea psittacipulmonis]